MPKMSGAQALIEALKREKVEVIFGLPGGAMLPTYDVLYDAGIRHVLAHHEQCVTPDTKILLNDTSIAEIGSLEKSWQKHRVLTFNPGKGGLESHNIECYVKRNPEEYGKRVYRLVTKETCREIKATGDHPFWSKRGWVKLEELKLGDQIAIHPAVEVEVEEVRRKEILTEDAVTEKAKLCLRNQWAIDNIITKLRKRGLIPLESVSEKLPAIARILGHLLGDGGLSSPAFDSKRNEYSIYAFFTANNLSDLETIERDLIELGFRTHKISEQIRRSHVITRRKKRKIIGKSLQLRSSSKELWCFFSALGAPIGSKANTPYLIPKWIMRGPKKAVREFLAAYNGSETRGVQPKTARTFSAPYIHFHKAESLKRNALAFSSQLITLLKKFGVKATVRIEKRHSRRRNGTYSDGINIHIRGHTENLLNFLRFVGYEYCQKRKGLATYVSEYLEMKKQFSERYAKEKREALRLLREGYSRKYVMNRFGLTRGVLDNWSYRKRSRSKVPSSIKPFKDWLKQATDGLFSGLVWETVAKIEDVEAECVIDISVNEAHTFIANGFLVHNCAAHMAEGYARASGRVGVCMATSGPGATNLVTGITDAHMDSVPVVAFTGQVPRAMIGKDAFQEADIIGVTTPITKHNFQPLDATEIPRVVKMAFYLASTGRPGPVLVDLPKDVQTEIAEMTFSESVEIRGYQPTYDPHPVQVKKAAELLSQAERPLILAGGGVIISNASNELQTLAEFLLAPVATSLLGKGSFSENHPLSLGMVGMHGRPEANKLIIEADVILAIGLRFSDRTTGKLEEFCPEAKIIHVDIDSAEIGKNAKVDLPIVADAKRALVAINEALMKKLAKKKATPWFDRIRQIKEQIQSQNAKHERGLRPQEILTELRKILPEDAIATTEVGQNQMWAALFFKTYKPRTFISSGGLGTMGFGFPAALGAKVARPAVPVVDIAGDGSFIMTEQELATSVLEKIPITVVILNNQMLGMVAQWQRMFYGRRYSAVKLDKVPDFVKLAEAYGAEGARVGALKEFTKAMKEALKNEVTTVIDVPISPEENVFPMVPAGKALKDMLMDMPSW